MITTKEYTDHSEVLKRIRNYSVEGVVLKTTTKEKYVLPGTGKKWLSWILEQRKILPVP